MEIVPVICIHCGARKNIVTQHKTVPQIVVVQFQADGWVYLKRNQGICAPCPKADGTAAHYAPREISLG